MSENTVYNSILSGLNEAIEDSLGEKKCLKRHKITIEPVKVYYAEDVKRIRKNTGLSQNSFAGFMGVSNKTVEAWESGTNHPSGAASRLLSMMEMDDDLILRFPFVTVPDTIKKS